MDTDMNTDKAFCPFADTWQPPPRCTKMEQVWVSNDSESNTTLDAWNCEISFASKILIKETIIEFE